MVWYGLRIPSGALGFGSRVSRWDRPPLTWIQMRFLIRREPLVALGKLAESDPGRSRPIAPAAPACNAWRRVMLPSGVIPRSPIYHRTPDIAGGDDFSRQKFIVRWRRTRYKQPAMVGRGTKARFD